MAWRDVARNLLRPGFLPVMADKVVVRLLDRRHHRELEDATRWCERRAEDRTKFARRLDAELWSEALEFSLGLERHGVEILASLGLPMGGAGDHALLYFLTRLRRPEVVVETGVAAGFSSHAVLAALAENGTGRLLSSDFPYFRLPDPANLVGCVVPESIRDRWELALAGDAVNLARFADEVEAIDMFHYDSDKTYVGRRRAFERIGPNLRRGAVVLVDDIQDNFFFRDLVERTKRPHHVFGFQGKYLGLIPRW